MSDALNEKQLLFIDEGLRLYETDKILVKDNECGGYDMVYANNPLEEVSYTHVVHWVESLITTEDLIKSLKFL